MDEFHQVNHDKHTLTFDQCYYQAEKDLNAVPDDGEKSVTDNGEEDTRNITNADIIDHIKTINGMATSNSQVLEEKNHFFVTQVMLPSAIVGVQ